MKNLRKKSNRSILFLCSLLMVLFLLPTEVDAQRRNDNRKNARKARQEQRKAKRPNHKPAKKISSSNTNKSTNVKMQLWTIGGMKSVNQQVTMNQMIAGLEDIGEAKDKAREWAKAVYDEYGGWESIVETAKSCQDLEACVEAGVELTAIGLTAGLGSGFIALIHRVRSENGSNVSLMNSLPGAVLKIDKSKPQLLDPYTFNAKVIIPGKNGEYKHPHAIKDAYASNKNNKVSGMVFNLSTFEKNKIEGTMPLELSIPGKGNVKLELQILNTVGAGTLSKYILKDLTHGKTAEVDSRYRYNTSSAQIKIPGKYTATIQLRHTNHAKRATKDQRKDALTVFISN